MSKKAAGTFGRKDFVAAERALSVYMDEINGVGFRCEFDRTPEDIEKFAHPTEFLAYDDADNIEDYIGRLRLFGGFIANLERLADRPIVRPHPLSWQNEYRNETTTYAVTAKDIATYIQFHNSIVDYVGALVNYGPSSLEATTTAAAAARIVDPTSWRKHGFAVPEGADHITLTDTREYLEMVLNQRQDNNLVAAKARLVAFGSVIMGIGMDATSSILEANAAVPDFVPDAARVGAVGCGISFLAAFTYYAYMKR